MIDVGFNLLAWTVLKRRNIQFVDRSLCECMGDQDPYERLLVEEKADLKSYRPKLVSLARGMALGKDNLFADMAESQRWISRIIRERADDETRISSKAVVNDTGDCLAKISIEILSRLVTHVIDGVHTMSPDMKDLVESSSNLGIFTVNEDGLLGVINVRSSLGEKETEILETQTALAEEAGYTVEIARQSDPWPYDPDSKLVELAKDVYKEQNGEDIEVVAVHARLECGTFKARKPDLDMISIGPDLVDVHTPGETLYIDSIPKTWHLLEGILAKV